MLHFIGGFTLGYMFAEYTDLKQTILNMVKYFYMPSSLEKVGKHKYKLEYRHNGRVYSILLPILRGPSRIYSIRGVNADDPIEPNLIDKVAPYLGPNFDFHNNPVTPREMGLSHSLLLIETSNGKVHRYGLDDIIDPSMWN